MKTYYRSNTIYDQSPSSIDRENGIIRDIVIVKTGEAKGHDIFLDEAFISDVTNFGNQNEAGVKARFGHPNICSTALGTYLGRYKNFRKVENKALADLYLDKSSIKSPKGNLYDYILDLAESNPEMFGASIAFKLGKEIVRKIEENGKEFNRNYATIKSLYAIDFVDDPAVTDGLFSAYRNTELAEVAEVFEDDFASQVTSFFDQHPEIFNLLDNKPEIFESFMTNYKNHSSLEALATEDNKKNPMNLKEEINTLKNWVSENFSKKKNEPGFQEEVNHRIETLENSLKDFSAESESLINDNAELEQGLTAFSDKLKTICQKFNLNESEIFSSESTSSEKLQHFETAINTLAQLIQSKDDELAVLQSELNKSLANPTIPKKNSDPLLSLENKNNKDFTGKVILENIPSTLRRKLKK